MYQKNNEKRSGLQPATAASANVSTGPAAAIKSEGEDDRVGIKDEDKDADHLPAAATTRHAAHDTSRWPPADRKLHTDAFASLGQSNDEQHEHESHRVALKKQKNEAMWQHERRMAGLDQKLRENRLAWETAAENKASWLGVMLELEQRFCAQGL